MQSKFKVNDKVRFTAEAASDRGLLSGLETDLLGERASDKTISKILTAIEKRRTLVVYDVDTRYNKTPHYSVKLGKLDMGAAFPEDQLERVEE